MNKRFFYEHKKEILAFVVLGIIAILLCIPFTLKYAVKVFGWAIWGYWVATCAFAVLYCLKKKIRLSKKSITLLAISLVCMMSTIHIACFDRNAARSFATYVTTAYNGGNTAGGVVFSIFTSPFVVLCTYVGSIVIFMSATAITTFLFFRPFIFEGKGNPFRSKEKNNGINNASVKEIIFDEAPFVTKKTAEKKPVPFLVDENKEESYKAKQLLFGKFDDDEEEDFPYSRNSDYSDLYQRKRIGIIKSAYSGRKEDDEENAIELLIADRKKDKDFDTLNYGEEETIFDSDGDEYDILKKHPSGSILSLFEKNTYKRDDEVDVEADKEIFEDTDVDSESPARPTPIPNIIGKVDTIDNVKSLIGGNEEDYFDDYEEKYEEEKKENIIRKEEEKKESIIIRNDEYMKKREVVSATEETLIRNKPIVGVGQSMFRPDSTNGLVGATEENESAGAYRKIVQQPKKPQLPYNKPPISMLKTHITPNFNPEVDNWDELKEIFEVKLANVGIMAELVEATKGPTITLCAIRLDDKCPVNKLISREKDLQRWLKSTKPIAILQQIPGTEYCGVQIPNDVKGMVGFKEIISSREYREAKGDIKIALGRTADGRVLIEDLAAMPHALVAGETGSGKSVCLNVILASILFRYSPDEVKLLLIDLKEVEMALYADLPHMLLRNPLSDPDEIVNALQWTRQEVVDRFNLFKKLHFRNLSEYNKQENVEKLPRIVVIIDEASELMENPNVRKTLESTLSSLARISRAAGVHLIFATQNPVKTVITNEIQNNLNTKIAFAVGDYNHSQVIFKAKGAECLLGKGDMYIKRGQEMTRAQCAFVDTPEIEEAVNYIKENNEYSFDEESIEKILKGTAKQNEQKNSDNVQSNGGTNSNSTDGASPDDPNCPDLMWQALKICVDTNYVSGSYLQRKLKRGYNTIANVLDQLAAEGYITAVPQGSKEKRELLITKEEFESEWRSRFGDKVLDEDEEFEKYGK